MASLAVPGRGLGVARQVRPVLPERLSPAPQSIGDFLMRTLLTTALFLGATSTTAMAGSFITLDDADHAFLTGLSKNGRIASGVFVADGQFAQSFTWRQGAGVAPLALDSAIGMNSWAQPVVGANDDGLGEIVAALAYSNNAVTGPYLVGKFPGGLAYDNQLSQGFGVSDDGEVVGLAHDGSRTAIAFRWTQQAGMSRLAVNRPTANSRANGISANGAVIYGWNEQFDGYRQGVLWIDGKVLELHNPGVNGDAIGAPPGEALGSNSTGTVVVGQGYYDEFFQSQAWRWTRAGGTQPIGILFPPPAPPQIQEAMSRLPLQRGPTAIGPQPFGFFSPPAAYALSASEDGDTVVGNTSDGFTTAAFIWTATDGMMMLSDYAAAHGVQLPEGFYMTSANQITPDGLTIAGNGIDATGEHFLPWIMDLRAASNRDSLVIAQGTIKSNNLQAGPFVNYPVGAAVSMSFPISAVGTPISPARDTAYPVHVPGFRLTANYQDPDTFERYSATERLDAAANPRFHIVNDNPRTDALDLPATATTTPGQVLEFRVSNPTGTLFDSDSSQRINRSFGPDVFDTITWEIRDGANSMTFTLHWVTVRDDQQTLFRSGFDD